MSYKDPDQARKASAKRQATYRKRHPLTAEQRERHRGYSLDWYHRNSAKRNAAIKTYRIELRAEVLAAYGGKCTCCAESHSDFLSIDHVNNDGAAHRREMRQAGGYNFYLWLRARGFPRDRFQLLCHNCNFAKGKYGSCPHGRPR